MLTLCYTLYNPKPETINAHLTNWIHCNEELRKQFKVVFVDDCSPTTPTVPLDFHMNMTVARIKDDIYWNLTGARNLAFHLADDDWCVTTDMDHFIEPEDLQKIVDMEKNRQFVYYFERYRNGKPHRTHLDSYIMHKQDFLNMGGYDEDMRGHRGANEDLIKAIIEYNNYHKVQTDIKIHNDESHGKVGGPRREMVMPNYVKLRQKLGQMKNGMYKNSKSLRFDWEILDEYTYPE